MSRISSTGITTSSGLVSGIPIEDTVNQLIQISAQPRDQLSIRTDGLANERAAVDQLAATVLSLQTSINGFSSSSTYTGRSATSTSDAVAVSVASGAKPSVGSYQFTPLSTASAHQFVSSSFGDVSDALGAGTLRIGFGGQVDAGVELDQLNGGRGVAAGEIRITDKNGDSATIDLRAARTVDDVLEAINGSADVDVIATAGGDTFTITDNTGGAGSLRVRDIGGGTTAADLGFEGATATGATTSITGDDVFTLNADTLLATLNDGLGVDTGSNAAGVADLVVTLRDGSLLDVDLGEAETLGDFLDAINNAEGNDGNLTASVRSDGFGIELTDNTGATDSNLIIRGEAGVAESLGIATGDDGIASATVSSRLASGLQDTLVSTLGGGRGLTLGEVVITDRSGATTSPSIDLSGAETLGDIVATINANAEVDVVARINDARTGIEIADDSGGAGNLLIADTGGTTTATDLGIAVDAAVASVNGGSLNRQTVGRQTSLGSLNGGRGIDLGDFRITDSSGATSAVDLNTSGSEAETVGDVIDRINALSISVTASINETGDGILLTDDAGGSGTLTVAEISGGTTAADLNLVGASSATDNSDRQVIDGGSAIEIDLASLADASDTVLLSSLNDGSGIDAGVFTITDSAGNEGSVNLGAAGAEAFTIDDVIDQINATGIGVTAALNDAGTGIDITDTAAGLGDLSIVDRGSGSAAADLGIAGESSTRDDEDRQTIQSGFLFSADEADASSFDSVVEQINALNAGVTASVLNDATGSRLVLTADNPGAANTLVVEAGGSALSFSETSRPTDAAALFGPSGAGVIVRSDDNRFDDVIDGLNLSFDRATGEPANLEVAINDQPLVDTAQRFVDSYNSVRSILDSFTAFDEESLTTGILFGRNEALRVDTDLSRIVSGRVLFGTDYGSLESVGISLNDDGTLSLNASELSEAFADDPQAVERLFTDEDSGVVTRLTTAIDQLAADENSLLSSRSDSLERTIESNNARITSLTESLEREREQLLLEFIRLEETIALLQSNTSAIDSIQPISISSSNGNN